MRAGYGTILPREERQVVTLARGIAGLIPTVMLTHPLLISPLLYAEELRKTADLRADAVGNFEQASTFLLTATFYPAIFLLAVGTFLIVWPRIDRRTWTILIWGILFVGFTVLSTVWSLAPKFTFLKSVANSLVLVSAVLPVLVARDPAKLIRPFFWLCALLVLLNFYSVLSRPAGPIGHEGIYEHKNIMGGVAAICLIFGAYGIWAGHRIEKLLGALMVVICLFLLVKSQSKTAIGFTFLSPMIALFLYAAMRWLRTSPLLAITIMIAAAFAIFPLFSLVSGMDLEDVIVLIFRDNSFTGRVFIWDFTIEKALERPWLGYGFQGFWNIGAESPRFDSKYQFIANLLQSHNGYLQIWLELGLVGVVLFTGLFVSIMHNVSRLVAFNPAFAIFSLTNMVFIIAVNLMETDWFLGATPATVLFLMIGLIASQPQARVVRDAHLEPAPYPHDYSELPHQRPAQ